MNRAERRKADQELAREQRRALQTRHTAGKILEEHARDWRWWLSQLVRAPGMSQFEFEWFCQVIAKLQGGPEPTHKTPASRNDMRFEQAGAFMDAQIGPILKGMPNPVRDVPVKVDDAETLRLNYLQFGAAETLQQPRLISVEAARRLLDMPPLHTPTPAAAEDARDWIPPMPNEEDE